MNLHVPQEGCKEWDDQGWVERVMSIDAFHKLEVVNKLLEEGMLSQHARIEEVDEFLQEKEVWCDMVLRSLEKRESDEFILNHEGDKNESRVISLKLVEELLEEGILSMEDEEVSLVDGVFEGALGALALEMEALVDAMVVYGG
nr:hypothetical protein [Tanacetum cinerariifolium]